MNTPVLLHHRLLQIMRSSFIRFGRAGENHSSMMKTMGCDIKDVHTLTLNSPFSFSRLRRVEISLL